MSKRLARRGLILSVLIVGALILGAVWVTFDAYRRESLRAPLVQAVKQNDAVQVQRLLKQGADPDVWEDSEAKVTFDSFLRRLLHGRHSTSFNTPSALMLAAQKGRLRIAELLVDSGANVNLQNGLGGSAIYWAAANGNTGVVRLLLSRGAKPNLLFHNRTSPLIAGARNPDIVQDLLDHGADANTSDVFGMTALMIAAQSGNAKSIQLLVGHGADPNAIRPDGSTALLDAEWSNLADTFAITKFLLEHEADPNWSNHRGETPLFRACHPNGNVETVRLLLEYKAIINVYDMHRDTPLHEAIGNVEYDEEPGNAEMVRLLLAHGADPNIKNRLGYTPLMKTPNASPDIRRLLQTAKH